MDGEPIIDVERVDGGTRLALAYENLGDVLETLDLERDRELAEAVVDAVAATDRAYRLERARREQPAAAGRRGSVESR